MVRLLAHKVLWRLGRARRPSRLLAPTARFPLLCRPNSSDYFVFEQIFVEREYACLDDVSPVDFVIDCGANVGYSSAYFLSRFPSCRLVAVEPDAENFAMLQRNTAPYGERVHLVRSGLWSHAAGLVMSQEGYRDGQHWTRQVRECRKGEKADFTATDIASLLEESGRERISILKMDIEGAEVVVFSAHYESWIDRVDIMAVELHDDTSFGDASGAFYHACGDRFSFSRSGELVIARRVPDSDRKRL